MFAVSVYSLHRDKTKMQLPAKNVSSFENYYVGCLWAPLLVLTQSKETVF